MRKLKIGISIIDIYDYYITNACVFKFIDTSFNEIKEIFGDNRISEFDILDDSDLIIESKTSLNVKLSTIQTKNEIVKYKEKILISDAYRETINGEEILHKARYKDIEKKENKTVYIAILEKISLEDEVEELKRYVNIQNPSTF